MYTQKAIKVGDIVEWKCRPYGNSPFLARGVVLEIGESTFGGMQKKKSVKIEPMGRYKNFFPYRKTTTIGMDKITH